MNWSSVGFSFVDNIINFFSFIELFFSILYFTIAFLNILVDTSETFGVLVLAVFVLLHQFNLLVSIHNASSFSKLYVTNLSKKNVSITKLYLSSFFLSLLSSTSKIFTPEN